MKNQINTPDYKPCGNGSNHKDSFLKSIYKRFKRVLRTPRRLSNVIRDETTERMRFNEYVYQLERLKELLECYLAQSNKFNAKKGGSHETTK